MAATSAPLGHQGRLTSRNNSFHTMNTPRKVGLLLGSLRPNGTSAGLAKALEAMLPTGWTLEHQLTGNLPLYNPDNEIQAPASWNHFRERVLACDALLFITPEYNRSIPGALKNGIDVGSRPYGQSVWNAKPAAIVSFSPGNLGGFGANHQLRQAFVCLNMPTMPAPEIYLSGSATLLNEHGGIANPDTQVFLERAMGSFVQWVERHTTANP